MTNLIEMKKLNNHVNPLCKAIYQAACGLVVFSFPNNPIITEFEIELKQPVRKHIDYCWPIGVWRSAALCQRHLLNHWQGTEVRPETIKRH